MILYLFLNLALRSLTSIPLRQYQKLVIVFEKLITTWNGHYTNFSFCWNPLLSLEFWKAVLIALYHHVVAICKIVAHWVIAAIWTLTSFIVKNDAFHSRLKVTFANITNYNGVKAYNGGQLFSKSRFYSALPEDYGSISSTHMVTQLFVTQF